MGVKTEISLKEVNESFTSFNFTNIYPTSFGIMDTTYILSTKKESYILKKYERNISSAINENIELLKNLKLYGLNVPVYIEGKKELHLYSKLKGSKPNTIKTYHIQALARFMAKMHKITYKKCTDQSFLNKNDIETFLSYTKSNFYVYYKKLESLKSDTMGCDGIIHGDIFIDNTVFDKNKIGVFDFIEASSGSFVFDVAVAILSFNAKKHNPYFINLFLNTYNQKSPKKISKKELLLFLETAKKFYALFGIYIHKNTIRAKNILWINNLLFSMIK